MSLLTTTDYRRRVAETAVGGRLGFAPYPYRYRALEPILADLPPRLDDRRAALATALGGQLMRLATRTAPDRFGDVRPRYTNADAIAYAVLDRARTGGACDPQLNLLLLVAADDQPRDAVIASEGARTRRTCRGHVTPGWVLGLFQSDRALLELTPVLPGDKADERRLVPRPFATFRALGRRFPRSAAAWSGAADADVRLALQQPPERAFTARHVYADALARYRRAAHLQADPAIAAGMTRALVGLHRGAEAARVQARAVRARPDATMLAGLVVAEEAARHWARAAAAAQRLAAMDASPPTDGPLFAHATGGGFRHPLDLEDAFGPLSLGAGRMTPLRVSLQPYPGGADASVTDLSFMPRYRMMPGITDSRRWCATWAYRRDLILAGRARDALDGFPRELNDQRDGQGVCQPDAGAETLADVARLELGDAAGAQAADVPLATGEDARQDLWRYAGDLGRAERAAREWVAALPGDPVARMRLGEIEFHRRHFGAAAETSQAPRALRATAGAHGASTRPTRCSTAVRRSSPAGGGRRASRPCSRPTTARPARSGSRTARRRLARTSSASSSRSPTSPPSRPVTRCARRVASPRRWRATRPRTSGARRCADR